MQSLALAVVALFLTASQVDARAGRGGGFGSRGSRTWSAPPPTTTAPNQAAPIQRSTTQPGAAVNRNLQQPAGQAARPGFFSTRGGLLGGLFGAGLFGMLLGYGLFGGLGGFGAILGLLLQVALIVILARLAFRFFQRRAQPAYAGVPAAGGAAPEPLRRDAAPPGAASSRGGTSGRGATAPGRDELKVSQADLDTFERLLSEVQMAYGREDVAALRGLATPEAVAWLSEELAENAGRGVVNQVADVKLLQGDVAESWREGEAAYATVAMRFATRDWTIERSSGRVVEGDPERPTEATEIWTFRRGRGGPWLLSAIQRA
jgi:predicted lipid-binding transport protein (Tim44 family)